MEQTSVSNFYRLSTEVADGDITVLGGPCVLKGVHFSVADNVTSVITFVLKDGSDVLFTLYPGTYQNFGGGSSVRLIPGLGIRVSDSLKFSTSAPTAKPLKCVNIFYQA
jgi:hypothetical protein